MTRTPGAVAAEPTPVRVLLIDDDREDYLLTKSYLADLARQPIQLDWAGDYDAGLAALCAGDYDVYLLDFRLGEKTGIELLHAAKAGGRPLPPVILLTGQGEYDTDRAAMTAGAADYLEKGRLDPTLLERSIRHALLQKRYEAELERKVRERTADLERLNGDLHREVAERTRAEEALKEADRRKDEFLATLAHELRNPLAPVRNALEIMRLAGHDPTAVDKARAVMDRQVAQMVRLIDDLLDVSRITRDKLRLETERLAVREVVEIALEISRPQIDKNRLELIVDVPTKPIYVIADRVRLAQVLSNLLNNAAKYTEPGGRVRVTAKVADGQAVLTVSDTGVGIPAEALPRLFDLFTQVNRTLNRSQGGLGIGLALVRRLVEMHGGTVSASSDGLGHGATFTVLLPLAAN